MIGGGPAGCWAAISAAEAGASVVLVDKGYCGTTGATASAGVGVWYIEPEEEAREKAIQSREALGGWLVDRRWMHRVLDETYARVGQLADWGYPFHADEHGGSRAATSTDPSTCGGCAGRSCAHGYGSSTTAPRSSCSGIDPARSPELAACAASTTTRWTVSAGAVVIATGGCAFLSGGLGCNVLTGDGHLMAAEARRRFSGMEFSNAYAISPRSARSPRRPSTAMRLSTPTTASSRAPARQRGRSVIAARAAERVRSMRASTARPRTSGCDLRSAQPNFFLPFDREGIDPFTDRVPGDDAARGHGPRDRRAADRRRDLLDVVAGLFAAGDAATRELICGGFTGGGSHNAAWAISSGSWAGQGAARSRRPSVSAPRLVASAPGRARPAGGAGIRACGPIERSLTPETVDRAVQAEVIPCDRNLFRTEQGMSESLGRLDDLWKRARSGLQAETRALGRRSPRSARASRQRWSRHARWMYSVGGLRTERRGMHKRVDHPELDPAQQHRRLVGGLDRVWTGPDPERPYSALELAA